MIRKTRLLAAVFFFVAAAGFCYAAQKDSAKSERETAVSKAREYYKAGQKALARGDYSAANEEFEKAELILGKDACAALSEPEAVPSGVITPLKDSRDSDFYYNSAVDLLKQGNYINAQTMLKKVIELDPQDKDACYNLGVLYDEYLSDGKEALKYYLRYLNLAPDAEDAGKVRAWIKDINARQKNKK